jgi:hypothetical protein
MFGYVSQPASLLGAQLRELSHGLFSNIEDHQIETRRQYVGGYGFTHSAQPNESDGYCHLWCCPIIRLIPRTMQYVSNQRNRVRKNGKFNITTP